MELRGINNFKRGCNMDTYKAIKKGNYYRIYWFNPINQRWQVVDSLKALNAVIAIKTYKTGLNQFKLRNA